MNNIHELSTLIQMTETTIVGQEREKEALQEKIDGLDSKLNEELSLLNAEMESHIKLLRQKYSFKQQEVRDKFLKTRQDLENQQNVCESNIRFAKTQASQHKKQLERLQLQIQEEQQKFLAEQQKQQQIQEFKFPINSLIFHLGDELNGQAVYYHITRLDTYNHDVVIFVEKCVQMPRLGKLVLEKIDEVILYKSQYEQMLVHEMPFEIKYK